MNNIYNAIHLDDDEKNKIGFKCSFCNRIYNDFDMVVQVVVVKKKKKSLCWMCDICKIQGRYTTINKETVFKNIILNKEYILNETNKLVFNKYRKSIWKE